jgi:hypothetical protein
MDWALEFYTKQNQWSGVYEEPINDRHRLKAGWIAELTGPGKKRILELGAGGGQVAAALSTAIGAPFPAREQALFQSVAATVRAQLGEAEFRAAWRAGQAMTLEQAVALALATV